MASTGGETDGVFNLDRADRFLAANGCLLAHQSQQPTGQRGNRGTDTERLCQGVFGCICLRHCVNCTTPFIYLLIWIANEDDLRVPLSIKEPQHHSVAILCLIEQDEIRFYARVRLRPDLQVDVRNNRTAAAGIDALTPQTPDIRTQSVLQPIGRFRVDFLVGRNVKRVRRVVSRTAESAKTVDNHATYLKWRDLDDLARDEWYLDRIEAITGREFLWRLCR
ncbi:hypothetical protein OKW34_003285 [Paraburkholderia youngii]